ncbi:MAG: DDE-type integrase/transposase/recombinase [Candidatus Hodarchaeota archaeon]
MVKNNEARKKLKKKKKDTLKRDAFTLYHNKRVSMKELARRFDRSARTIRRWIQDVKQEGMVLEPRQVTRRTRARAYVDAVFDRIIELKLENPLRSAVIVHKMLTSELGEDCPSLSLVRKHLAGKGLSERKGNKRTGYVKFTRPRPNDLWQIDIAGVRTIGHLGKVYLHAILDDHSRFVVAARYHVDQRGINVLRLLRDAFEEYGLPRQILADNGSQFRNVLGELGTKYSNFLEMIDVEPIFASPRHPQTKGKLERWFGTVVQGFLAEARFRVEKETRMTIAGFNKLLGEWISW